MRGYGEEQGSAVMLELVSPWDPQRLVEGRLSSSSFNDPEQFCRRLFCVQIRFHKLCGCFTAGKKMQSLFGSHPPP